LSTRETIAQSTLAGPDFVCNLEAFHDRRSSGLLAKRGAFVPLRDARRLPCDTRNLLGELEISTKASDSLDPLELQVDACIRELWGPDIPPRGDSPDFSFRETRTAN
jgi:hypothetical protein